MNQKFFSLAFVCCTIALLFLQSGCSSDVTGPMIANSILSSSSISGTGFSIGWDVATDDFTASDFILYSICRTTSGSLTSLTDIDQNTVATCVDTTTNPHVFTDLTPGFTYTVNVIAKDLSGNRSVFATLSINLADTNAPTTGTALSFNNVTVTSLTANWGLASDTVTSAANLEYKVVRAFSSAAIDTVAEVDAISGAALAMDWTANVNSFTLTGLLGNTTYFIAVIVRDAAHNMALYTPASQATTSVIYMFIAALGNGDLLTRGGGVTAREGADNLCVTAKGISFSSLTCSDIRALISISGADEVRDMPGNYSVPTTRQVFSSSGVKIADDWADLLDGTTDSSLSAASVTSSYFWMGTAANGSIKTDTCSGFDSSNSADTSYVGSPLGTNNMFDDNRLWFCDAPGGAAPPIPHLCVCF